MRKDRESVTELPSRFVSRINEELGQSEAQALCEALEGDAPVSVRYNPYKMDSAPQELRSIGWSRYGFYLDERPSFTLDSAHHAGVYYVQEASSQFVGHILSYADTQGAKVLDVCAAPGGKSTLYSVLVGMEGLVVANEINKQRASVLVDNVKRWGLGNIVVTNGDSARLAKFESWWDIVAVDAPCSGEGMFRKSQEARTEWSESNVSLCVKRQQEIIRNGWQALKPGGVLIYSTCTFNRAENEELLQEFVDEMGDECVPFESVECGDEWGVVCSQVGTFQTFRFFPHRAQGEGFFVAVARKSFDAGGRAKLPKPTKSVFANVNRDSLREVSSWVEQGDMMHFTAVGDTIYGYHIAQADNIKRLAESLTVIYSGVAMGQIFKGRLKPDPALALYVSLNREAVGVGALDETEILSYLRRADVSAQRFDNEGINLVTDSRGNAVGWVKRVGNRVNNLYSNSMRILK